MPNVYNLWLEEQKRLEQVDLDELDQRIIQAMQEGSIRPLTGEYDGIIDHRNQVAEYCHRACVYGYIAGNCAPYYAKLIAVA